ncbi:MULTISPECIES: HIT family protein [unclassified Haladaptatus]|uniref:HIT family protein n=1 Tax=unclassified Haladaptatus TaxID=2622732 RepID=UPI0023E7E25A|nr:MULTISPECIES: HIT family protein [unclassified Haladaptatus]
MDDDCIFCKIIDGEIPSRTVYEDDQVLAFLDVNPLTRGHTLVIPKSHHQTVADLPEDVGEAVFTTLYRLTPAVESAVSADGSNIGINNGTAAGQEVQHVHAHIVPRFEGDGGGAIHSIVRTMPDLTDDEFDDIAADIRANAD